MLTSDELEAAKSKGKLIPVTPLAPFIGSPRAFLVSKVLWEEIQVGRNSENSERWARLEGDMKHFVGGGFVNWSLMKWLDPHKFEHWNLRSKRPKPSLRVFGRFALPDVFVGTHVVARGALNKKWHINWELEKLRCEDIWKDCGLKEPFSGSAYDDYITENARRDLRI
jgi:hypothetical protein